MQRYSRDGGRVLAHHNPMEDVVVRRRASHRQRPPETGRADAPSDPAQTGGSPPSPQAVAACKNSCPTACICNSSARLLSEKTARNVPNGAMDSNTSFCFCQSRKLPGEQGALSSFQPLSGFVSQNCTIRSGSLYGRGRSRTALTTLKMELFAPIPNASDNTAANVTTGVLRIIRQPNRKSLAISLIQVQRRVTLQHGHDGLGLFLGHRHSEHGLAALNPALVIGPVLMAGGEPKHQIPEEETSALRP